MIKIAINGFGRIGRAAFKIALETEGVEVVALNDLTDTKTLAHLLRYDTAYGHYERDVAYDDNHIIIDGVTFPVYNEKDPAKLPWGDLEVDVVVESTGVFRTRELADPHVTKAGAKAVVISAPGKSPDIATHVLGVNGDQIADGETVISNASCTTNCIAPVINVLHSAFGVKKAALTTIHSYTADQRLVDAPHKDLRRARAAAQNIIPTSTGAAIATTKTIPDLEGKFDGMAVRVPTPVGSLSDITVVLEKAVTVEEVNDAFRQAAASPLYDGILDVTDEPLVSSDFIGNSFSSTVDLALTQVIDGDLIKVVAWYDNELGYSHRLIEIVQQWGESMKG